jgi:hypothetical protein
MNNFTKEELKILISWGELYTEFGSCWTDKIHRPLLDKVKNMIRNNDAQEIRICPNCGSPISIFGGIRHNKHCTHMEWSAPCNNVSCDYEYIIPVVFQFERAKQE